MKKETKIIVFIAACIVVAFSVMAIIFGCDGGEALSRVYFEEEITVQDGVADPASFTDVITIPKDGRYQMHFEWTSAAGLITGARLVSEEGETLLWLTGEGVDADMQSLPMEKGIYLLEFVNLTNAEDFMAFAVASSNGKQDGRTVYDASGEASDIGEYEFAGNGVFHNTYSYEIVDSNAFHSAETVGILLGLVIGLIIAALLLIFTKKDRKIEAEYDEMQQHARGTGYCIGFWTALIYFSAVAISDAIGVQLPAETSVIAFTGILFSIFTFAVYCIWTDAYFAMNENRRTFYIVFLIIGIVNLALGAFNIMGGAAVADGILTFRSLNLFCGLFFAAIGVVLFIKKVREKDEED